MIQYHGNRFLSHVALMLWEKFQWILPLYMKSVSCESNSFSYLFNQNSPVYCQCLSKLTVLSHIITTKVNEYPNSAKNSINWIINSCDILWYYLSSGGWVTHLCGDSLTIIGSDNGLPSGPHQAIYWTDTGILLNGPIRTNFSEILTTIHTFSFEKWLTGYHL